jgi:uncharacterized YkwD family protein
MKKFLAVTVLILAVVLGGYGLQNRVEGTFATTSVKQVKVNISSLNLRSGADTSHSVITSLPQGTILQVLGKIGNWYVVKTNDDSVGCVSQSYVTTYTAPTTPTTPTSPPASTATAMQQEMLGYINADRAKANLAPLTLNSALCNGAALKSKDMAVNNYFDHNSPTYGSPFDMMRSLGITYQMAGENIAINTSVKAAHDAFMNSPGHRANILRSGFGKVGLGFYQKGLSLYVTEWFTN